MADSQLKSDIEWEVGKVHIKYGAAVGACAVVLPNVTIGRFALVGAGSVVTRDVPDYGLVAGNPARLVGYVCRCGHRLINSQEHPNQWHCDTCQEKYDLPALKT